MRRSRIFQYILLPCLLLVSCTTPNPTIYYSDSSQLIDLSSREIRKYIYQRTNRLLNTNSSKEFPKNISNAIVLINAASGIPENIPETIKKESVNIGKEDYNILSENNNLYIIGGSDLAVLYGAYRYAEKIGVRFHLHGDVIPDKPFTGSLTDLPEEKNSPLFSTRGLLPFHDFPEGPDWWNEDDYKAYFAQMLKLRMNFLGLHTYPENGPHAEPSIWIGSKKDILPEGKVSFSYPATFANTQRPNYWSYAPLSTKDFSCGASSLFARDVYGPNFMKGLESITNEPDSLNVLFEKSGEYFSSIFNFGNQLGIKFCMGTEVPLTIPEKVKDRLSLNGVNPDSNQAIESMYEGIFTRIKEIHHLDYYWLWTPESWTWGNPTNQVVDKTINDIKIANNVLAQMGNPFELALCGWVLGPPQDRGSFDEIVPQNTAISCISRMWGQDRIEEKFYNISNDRPKWAIPWLEEDPRMTIPQFWAGRMRADAADALDYGCNGLIGIHWRTKSISPNINALAEATWTQESWNPNLGKTYSPKPLTEDGRIGGKIKKDDGQIIKGTENSPVFNSLCYDIKNYLIKVPNGVYTVTLQFCETHYDAKGKRIFGVNVEGEEVATHLDVFSKVGKNKAYEIKSKQIKIKDGILNIDFNVEVENPIISGIIIEGKTDDVNQVKGTHYHRAINAGGLAYKEYEKDLPEATGKDSALPRDLESLSFYKDYALHEFGEEMADSIASILESIDGFYENGGNDNVKIPRPANWVSGSGPGAIMPNRNLWENEKHKYEFVERFTALAPYIKGKGNIDRYNYWSNTFKYTQAMAKLGCTRGLLDILMEKADKITDSDDLKVFVRNQILPLRIQMSREWEVMMTFMLQTIYTPGELGTTANLEQLSRTFNHFLDSHDNNIRRYIGKELPDDVKLSSQYKGSDRIILLTERSLINADETLHLRVIALSPNENETPILNYRELGTGQYKQLKMTSITDNIFEITVPEIYNKGLEYYISLKTPQEIMVYPCTAPEINNVVMPF